MRLDKLNLLPLLACGFAMGLTACGGDTAVDDTGWADADTDTDADSDTDSDTDADSDTDTDYFDTYATSIQFYTGWHEDSMSSVYFSGSEQPPLVEIQFYEEDYFEAGDDRYTCYWVGAPVLNSLSDLELGDNIWIGWDVSLQLADPSYTNCTDFDPELWGEDTPTTVFETLPFGMGWGPPTTEFYTVVHDGLIDYGWSETDWEDQMGPFMFAHYIALYDDTAGALVGFENGIARSFVTDDAYEVVGDDDGYLIPIEVRNGPSSYVDMVPDGYVNSSPWYYWYAEALYLQ